MTEDYLFVLAEIAVALIGFSGVVTALGRRGKGQWQAAEKIRLLALIEPSAITLIGSLLPSTLFLLAISEDAIWRISNLSVLLLHLIAFSLYIKRSKGTDTLLSQKVMAAIAVLVFIGLALSSFNLISYHEFTFTLGLLLGIAVGIFNFFLLLIHVDPEPERPID